jgi:antitoxin (DNA-binding transcriptional repressor) of toxin-antitoxin stability system
MKHAYTLRDAKARLSALLDLADAGELVEISRDGGRKGRYRILLVEPGEVLRKPGALKGKIWIADDFDAEDPELTAAFESGI